MIELENVSRSFGTFKAVNSINFSIKTGEIVGLLGPNGAGKTTTMRMITGFIEQDSGIIKIDGVDIRENPKQAKRKIGYMSESAPLYGEMIVADYLDYCAKMQNVEGKERIPYLAKVCGLEDVMHKNISELSRGYKQRVGLAHALMNDPEILILDEPTSGLDPNQIMEVRSLIKQIGKTRTVIVSTHILSEVEMICDRVIIISKGNIVADSLTEELRSRYGQKLSIFVEVNGCTEEDLEKALKSVEGVESISFVDLYSDDSYQNMQAIAVEKKSVAVRVTLNSNKEIRPEIACAVIGKKWNLLSLYVETNTLEDVFKSLTTGGE
ncbi:MAG: ABC transporter ATP-binding protein [Treponemataceae bacterium]